MQRWIVLFGAVLVQMVLGGVYAWSTFANALAERYPLSSTQTQSVFAVAIATFTLVMIPAGRLLDRLGPRLIAATGGVLFALGCLLAALSGGNPWLLIAGGGILAGAGIGFGYICPLSTCAMWFPNNRGLVTGVAVAGFGAGAVAMSSAAEAMLGAGMEVLVVLGWVGVVGGAVVILGAMGLSRPEDTIQDQSPKTWRKIKVAMPVGVPRRAMISRALRLTAGLTAGTFAGLLVVGNLKDIGESRGVEGFWLASVVSVFAVGNAAGRLLAGYLADRFGSRAIPLSLLAIAGSVLLLWATANEGAWFLLSSLLVAMAFGACFVVYAAEVGREFGPGGVSRLYPWMFLGYGFSGLVAPIFGAALYDMTGNYTPALIAAAVLAVAASSCLIRNPQTAELAAS